MIQVGIVWLAKVQHVRGSGYSLTVTDFIAAINLLLWSNTQDIPTKTEKNA